MVSGEVGVHGPPRPAARRAWLFAADHGLSGSGGEDWLDRKGDFVG